MDGGEESKERIEVAVRMRGENETIPFLIQI
jgi:hypothetical protein